MLNETKFFSATFYFFYSPLPHSNSFFIYFIFLSSQHNHPVLLTIQHWHFLQHKQPISNARVFVKLRPPFFFSFFATSLSTTNVSFLIRFPPTLPLQRSLFFSCVYYIDITATPTIVHKIKQPKTLICAFLGIFTLLLDKFYEKEKAACWQNSFYMYVKFVALEEILITSY